MPARACLRLILSFGNVVHMVWGFLFMGIGAIALKWPAILLQFMYLVCGAIILREIVASRLRHAAQREGTQPERALSQVTDTSLLTRYFGPAKVLKNGGYYAWLGGCILTYSGNGPAAKWGHWIILGGFGLTILGCLWDFLCAFLW